MFTDLSIVLDKSTKGPFKKYVTGLGERGSSKIVTKCDKGEGSSQRLMLPLQKNIVSTITLE